MTSRERVKTALAGSKPDRVPVGPFLGYAAAPAMGASLRSYYTDGATIARAQDAFRQEAGHDILVTAADTHYISEAFGMQTVHHENALPTAVRPLFTDLEQVSNLSVPDPKTDGRMPVYLKALDEMRVLSGKDVALRGTGTGPFSLAAYMFGEANFLMILAELESGERGDHDLHLVRALLDVTADTTIAFLEEQLRHDADILYVGDSFASADMISPGMYRRFAYPYHRKVFDAVAPQSRSRGVFTMLHICGDNRPILPDFASLDVDLIEIDQKVDIAEARDLIGPAKALIGNLDPTRTLLQGTPEDVYRESLRVIGEARGTDGRFILGSGCFVPLGTTAGNIREMVHASADAASQQHQQKGETE